jgi:hypothetical protein
MIVFEWISIATHHYHGSLQRGHWSCARIVSNFVIVQKMLANQHVDQNFVFLVVQNFEGSRLHTPEKQTRRWQP